MSKRNRNRNTELIQQPSGSFATITQSVTFSGPLPHPSLLAKYNEVIPDGAERIMAMAEKQSEHREHLEALVIEANVKSQHRGTLYAFILCLVALVGGFSLIALGKDGYGIAAIITAIASLAGVFIYGKLQQKKEREEKAKTLANARR